MAPHVARSRRWAASPQLGPYLASRALLRHAPSMHPHPQAAEPAPALLQARDAYRRRAWADAYARFSAADRDSPLTPDDRDRLAVAAYLLGREAESTELWARAHHEFAAAGATDRAVRCAFWLAVGLLEKGGVAQASGWLARARRLLDDAAARLRRARLPPHPRGARGDQRGRWSAGERYVRPGSRVRRALRRPATS